MRDAKDISGKLLVQLFGGAFLNLSGHGGFTSWRPGPTEIVSSRRVLDGLIEATYPGSPEPVPYIVEIESYPDRDNDRQVLEAVMAVCLSRRVVPEGISLVLARKGNVQPREAWELRSPSGEVALAGRWRTIRMWELEAEDLFAMNDVGVVPWIPLTHTTATPTELITRCREAIDAKAPAAVRDNMLAVTHVMARINYNDPGILKILGGSKMTIESPAFDEVKEIFKKHYFQEGIRESIIDNLMFRFGDCPADFAVGLGRVTDSAALKTLVRQSLTVTAINEFPALLAAAPVSDE